MCVLDTYLYGASHCTYENKYNNCVAGELSLCLYLAVSIFLCLYLEIPPQGGVAKLYPG